MVVATAYVVVDVAVYVVVYIGACAAYVVGYLVVFSQVFVWGCVTCIWWGMWSGM